MQVIKEQECTMKQLMSIGWQIFNNRFSTIFTISLVVFLPYNVFNAIFGNYLIEKMGWRAYLDIPKFYQSLVGVLAVMAIILVVRASLDDELLTWREALKAAADRWTSAIFTNLIASLIAGLLLLLLIVPGLIWLVYYYFSNQVVVLKSRELKDALDYSKSIVKGHWWKVFGISLLLLILQFSPIIVGVFLPDNFLTSLIVSTVTDIVSAYIVVVTTILFINLDWLKDKAQEVSIDISCESEDCHIT